MAGKNDYFTTITFTGATNPALTPIPFNSITETAGNDALYGATAGAAGSPGMRCTFGGTSADCYGSYTLPMAVTATGRVFRAACDWLSPVLPFAGLSGRTHVILRFRAGSTDLASLTIVKANTTDLLIRVLDDVGGGGTSGTTILAAATFYNFAMEMDCSLNEVRGYLNTTLECTRSIVTPITSAVSELRAGAVGSGFSPLITIEYDIDNLAASFTQIPHAPGAAGSRGTPCARLPAIGFVGMS